jgi:hypothetical protein
MAMNKRISARKMSIGSAHAVKPRLSLVGRPQPDNIGVRVATDPDECRDLWQMLIPPETITDLWEVRNCFHQQFRRPLHFIVAEDGRDVIGLIPLCFIEEMRCYGYFPGETWHGKTWLEQNRIHSRRMAAPSALLPHCRFPYHLRYLTAPAELKDSSLPVDEIGYLFFPPTYDFSIENYFKEFSHKKIKQILRDIAEFEKRGVTYRFDDPADFDLMIRMNLSRFGAESYFYDARFRESFRSLACLLQARGLLRLTTVLVAGEPAAVDMGCLYRGTYTIMAGGASSRFPGIAKLINMHHLQRACDENMRQVDFLCGDFNWKKLFHLTPRPLYLLSNLSIEPKTETLPQCGMRPAHV